MLLKLACLLFAGWHQPVHAEVRRALLVGIDKYIEPASVPGYKHSELTLRRLKEVRGTPARRKIEPLSGAFNDAKAMQELLIQRFGFEERNIAMLPDAGLKQPATAEAILTRIRSQLIDSAQPGDISFFYYAGHGSRIRNTADRNANASGMDSTIVPADALLGVPDIRSKELARLYQQAAAKGIQLTVIMDSCYSGAATRGRMTTRRIRAEAPDTGSVSVDETLEGGLPEDNGVLFISASQDHEPAAELDVTDLGEAHGAFTWALLHTLASSPANERVDRIFQRTRALMQAQVAGQEPVLLARQGRNVRGLFGQKVEAETGLSIAVRRVAGQAIRLNGGLAMNLREGCELRRLSAGKAVRIRITSVRGVSSSDASVIEGSASEVQPGDLFALEKWVVPDEPLLKVYVDPAVGEQQLAEGEKIAGALRHAGMWVPDLGKEAVGKEAPTHIVRWDASRGKWSLHGNSMNGEVAWLDRLSIKALTAKAGKDARLFVQANPTAKLREQLLAKLRDSPIQMVSSAGQADYSLIGRFGVNGIEYAWTLPDTGDPVHSVKPLRTNWDRGEGLMASALALARLNGWLNLNAPAAWPYELALKEVSSGRLVSGGAVVGGEHYKLMLQATSSAGAANPRHVYVFVVDSSGEAQLVFGDNLQNEFPRAEDSSSALIPLSSNEYDFEIGKPFGIDHYYMLSSETVIDNPRGVFSAEAVLARGGTSSTRNVDPLARLFAARASASRGTGAIVPSTWSIQRLTLLSRAPDEK